MGLGCFFEWQYCATVLLGDGRVSSGDRRPAVLVRASMRASVRLCVRAFVRAGLQAVRRTDERASWRVGLGTGKHWLDLCMTASPDVHFGSGYPWLPIGYPWLPIGDIFRPKIWGAR